MKKTLTLLVAVAAIAAFAGSASAVTCTLDTRPAATLLIPYFEVAMDAASGLPVTGDGAIDTIVNIVNASQANTVAHVVVWNRSSAPVLDVNIPFTGFDSYTFFMSGLLAGHLPENTGPAGSGDGISNIEVCEKLGGKNSDLEWTGPGSSGYLRFVPTRTPNVFDLKFASTHYTDPLFDSTFRLHLAAELDGADDCAAGTKSPNGEALIGYVTIDMVNYCTLSNPAEKDYWNDDAAGFENNFFGDYIISTGTHIPTYATNMVSIEAEPNTLNGCAGDSCSPIRTFYARYWEDPDGDNFGDSGDTSGNGDENTYLTSTLVGAPFLIDRTYGDMREPLSTRWAVRYADASGLATYLRVWRSEADSGNICTGSEPVPTLTIYDEDENPFRKGGCQISPCATPPPVNIPWETQRCNTFDGTGAPNDKTACDAIIAEDHGGWIFADFIDTSLDQDNESTVLAQAWMGFDIGTAIQFVNVAVDGTQLDPNTCLPVHNQEQSIRFNEPVVPVYVGLGY